MSVDIKGGVLSPDTQLILDQPLLRVPYELCRKNYKTSQRNVERTRDDVLASLKKAANGSMTYKQNADAIPSLDSMISKMEGLKRKLTVCRAEEEALHRASKARIDHINGLHSINTLMDVKYDEWAKVRLNRLLVDYLLRFNYGDTALALAKAEQIEDLVDIDAFIQCENILDCLRRGRTQEALAWCQDNKQALKKTNSELEFELRLQQLIELLRNGDKMGGCAHARKYLSPFSNTESGVRAVGLLPYSPSTIVEPYKSMYSQERWEHLGALFLQTHHELLALPTRPALHVALSAGLSALKTPSCHSSHLSSSSNANTSSGSSVCPICSTELHELARNVPYANHSKSVVESDPVALPNGRVYGRQRLIDFQQKMPASSKGWLRDPSEPELEFEETVVKKVYFS